MISRFVVLLLVPAMGMIAQPRPESLPSVAPVSGIRSGNERDSEPAAKATLSINDQLVIVAREIDGISEQPYRIELDGAVALPLVGRVRAVGMTVEEFERELVRQFAVYVRSPQISVKRLGSQPESITVVGAFKNPGIYLLSDRRSLLDVLSAAGGLQPNAARTIKIARRLGGGHTPLPSGVEDAATGVSTAVINVSRLMENPHEQQILIEPSDVLSAAPAGVVFLTGEVLKPGAIELMEKDSIDLTELISMGGGFAREAAPDRTTILRPVLNGSRRAQISVDVKSILDGRKPDFPVMPNDMVLVPRAKGRSRAVKTVAMYVLPGLATSLIFLATR